MKVVRAIFITLWVLLVVSVFLAPLTAGLYYAAGAFSLGLTLAQSVWLVVGAFWLRGFVTTGASYFYSADKLVTLVNPPQQQEEAQDK